MYFLPKPLHILVSAEIEEHTAAHGKNLLNSSPKTNKQNTNKT